MITSSSKQSQKPLSKKVKINKYFAYGVDEMHVCGMKIAQLLTVPSIVYFHGGLGAGKTTLVQGICQYFQYSGVVSSPSYNLIHEYPCRKIGGDLKIAHLDLYRLENPEELDMLGLADLLSENSILLIEWPEKGSNYVPQYDVKISLSDFSDQETGRVGRQLEIIYK